MVDTSGMQYEEKKVKGEDRRDENTELEDKEEEDLIRCYRTEEEKKIRK